MENHYFSLEYVANFIEFINHNPWWLLLIPIACIVLTMFCIARKNKSIPNLTCATCSNELPKNTEVYDKWEKYRITQLSYSINLFLGFAVASLVYAINLKLNMDMNKNIPNSCILLEPEALVLIIKFWSWSALLGCVATISRLLDFRFTAKKAEKGGKFYGCMTETLGAVTWGMFWTQILTYLSGAYYFILIVMIA